MPEHSTLRDRYVVAGWVIEAQRQSDETLRELDRAEYKRSLEAERTLRAIARIGRREANRDR